MPTNKRTPLKEAPLHYPGQSIDHQIDDLRYRVFMYFLSCACFIMLTVAYWDQWLHPTRIVNPAFATIFTTVVIAYCSYKIVRAYGELQRLKLGRYGELAVGQGLEDLRRMNCQVFHDVVGENFNIDHVVISPTGIYTIETKTVSKPLKGKTVIRVEGEKVLINGAPSKDSDALNQARAEAKWLRDLLEKSTGKKYPIRPVILFPGWYVDQPDKREVWALNLPGLKAFIGNEKQKLPTEDVYLAALHLSLYIRSKDKEASK